MQEKSVYKFLPPALAERLRNFEFCVKQALEGHQQGQHRSPHFGSSVEFAEYRDYAPGDPVALLDWAVYARSDRYVIRRFHGEVNINALIILDSSASMGFQERGDMSKFDYARFLAAALMFILINQKDTVGLITFDRKIRERFESARSAQNMHPILKGLEVLKASGASDIGAALHQLAESITEKSHLIIISDFLEKPAGIHDALRHLRHNGHEVRLLQVLDQVETRFEYSGMVEMKEIESGSRTVVNADEIAKAYRNAVEEYFSELRHGCGELNIDHTLLETHLDIESSLAALLRKH